MSTILSILRKELAYMAVLYLLNTLRSQSQGNLPAIDPKDLKKCSLDELREIKADLEYVVRSVGGSK